MDEILTYFLINDHWQWWALAMVLFIAEMIFPVFFLLWPGLAALVVGFAVYFFDGMGWEYQLILFAVLSVAITVAGRHFWAPSKTESDEPTLNEKGKGFVGRKVTLKDDLPHGEGRIHLDDSGWRARSEDGETLSAGTRVEIMALDGTTVIVKKI